MAEMDTFFDPVENIVGKKDKMLLTSIFSFFHNVFKKASDQGWLKVGIEWYKINSVPDDKIKWSNGLDDE